MLLWQEFELTTLRQRELKHVIRDMFGVVMDDEDFEMIFLKVRLLHSIALKFRNGVRCGAAKRRALSLKGRSLAKILYNIFKKY